MARKNRIWFPGATYHITARGNNQNKIFYDTKDYMKYKEIIRDTQLKYPFLLHSYCLMNNHIHLQLETKENSISKIMKQIQMNYAIYLNKKYSLVGHVFQGRFGARIILSVNYFLTVNRYIHLNPVEANLVAKPESYPWSSYHSYISNENDPLITTSKTLSYFQNSNLEYYRYFIENPIEEIVIE